MLNSTALTLQETDLRLCLRDPQLTGFHVFVDELERGAILSKRVLSRDILDCVGWRERVDYISLNLPLERWREFVRNPDGCFCINAWHHTGPAVG